MAFSNLWSSERLSFSLSIVAVISAAITSYYQFFWYNSNVEYVPHIAAIQCASVTDGVFQDSLTLKITFMNNGSTPVSVIESRLFLLNSNAKNGLGSLEKQKLFHRIKPSIDSVIYQVPLDENLYLNPKSVNTHTFQASIDSISFMNLIHSEHAPGNSSMTQLEFGVYLLMADPHGNFSKKAISVIYPFCRLDGRCAKSSLDVSAGSMPDFDSSWSELVERYFSRPQLGGETKEEESS